MEKAKAPRLDQRHGTDTVTNQLKDNSPATAMATTGPNGAKIASVNRDQVHQALGLFAEAGALIECRVPGTRKGTVSGYFSDHAALVKVVAQWSGRAEGVYITLNPVDPALLGRSANQMREYAKHTTGDREVLQRRWLLVDLDPVRPSGVSATDAEHDAALRVGHECANWLNELGWPEPVLADSGNGCHLLFRLDLPNDADSQDLVKRVLKALAFRFDEASVTVDQTTFNAARLVKVYGTLAAKGDVVPDRPHRLSSILTAPDDPTPVPVSLLQDVAERIPPDPTGPQASSTGRIATGAPFDLERWISEVGLDVIGPRPWNKAQRWKFRICPWNEQHTNSSAYLVQFTSGAIQAGCLHNSCKGKNWHDLRDLYEPAWRERTVRATRNPARPATPQLDSVGSGALTPLRDRMLSPSGESESVEPFPIDVFPKSLAGFIEEAAAAFPCPPDFVGVPMLVALGAAIGNSRVIQVKPGWTEGPRLWVGVVADPGSKKSPALEIATSPVRERQAELQARYLQQQEVHTNELADYEMQFAAWKEKARKAADGKGPDPGDRPVAPLSPVMSQVFTTDSTMEGLAVLLQQNPRGILFCRDELAGWARSMDQYRGGKGADRQSWLSFWSGTASIVNRKGQRDALVLSNPFVSVAGCLPPDVLGDLSDERGREDGFVHRLLFAFPDRATPQAWTDAIVSQEAMDGYQQVFTALWSLAPKTDRLGQPEPATVSFTPEGKATWVEWYNSHLAETNDVLFPVHLQGPWAKMEGYCARLALILHFCRLASGDASSEDVDQASTLGAAALIDYFKSHARKVYTRLHTTPEDKRVTQAVTWIRKHGGQATARDLQRHHVSGVKTTSDVKMLFRELADRGYGTVEEGERNSVIFRLDP